MTIRVKGRYKDQKLELDRPLELAEGTEVELEVHLLENESDLWQELGMTRLEAEWDNPQDAVYDNWRSLYGI